MATIATRRVRARAARRPRSRTRLSSGAARHVSSDSPPRRGSCGSSSTSRLRSCRSRCACSTRAGGRWPGRRGSSRTGRRSSRPYGAWRAAGTRCAGRRWAAMATSLPASSRSACERRRRRRRLPTARPAPAARRTPSAGSRSRRSRSSSAGSASGCSCCAARCPRGSSGASTLVDPRGRGGRRRGRVRRVPPARGVGAPAAAGDVPLRRSPADRAHAVGTAWVTMTLAFVLVTTLVFLAWLTERRVLLWPAFAIASPSRRLLALGSLGGGAERVALVAARRLGPLSAASMWAGGVVMLSSRSSAPASSAAGIRRLRRLAPVLIALLVVAGVYLSFLRLPELADLWTTSYGQILDGEAGARRARAHVGSGAPLRRRAPPRPSRHRLAAAAKHCRGGGGRHGRPLFAAILVNTAPPGLRTTTPSA